MVRTRQEMGEVERLVQRMESMIDKQGEEREEEDVFIGEEEDKEQSNVQLDEQEKEENYVDDDKNETDDDADVQL